MEVGRKGVLNSLHDVSRLSEAKFAKVFWFFFSKKNSLAFRNPSLTTTPLKLAPVSETILLTPEQMLPDGDQSVEGWARIMALPGETRDRLACLACLGGEVAPPLLAAACDISLAALWQDLAPALKDALVLSEPGDQGADTTLRFRNEDVRQSVYDGMEAGAPQAWHLSLARRLAPLAEYADAAVEQYLHAVAAIHDPEEAETACALFAAAATRGLGPDMTERYHAAQAEVRAQAGGDVPATVEAPGPQQEIPAVSPQTTPVDWRTIVLASQALSAQTDVSGLRSCAAETLASMTGATAVRLAVWDDAGQAWDAGESGTLPLSVLSMAEQAQAPLLVHDAMLDNTLASDPYFAGAERCSLLVLPVPSPRAARAMLVLENRLAGGGFAPAHVDMATLAVGQLAVSLESAHLTAAREHRIADMAHQRAATEHQLAETERRLVEHEHQRAEMEHQLAEAAHQRAEMENRLAEVAHQRAEMEHQLADMERRLAERTETLALAKRRLEILSISDALTGLPNRRRFDDVLAREWLRALRGGTSIGLVMVDIDYFKRYNDHYSHKGGDQCLRAVATALRVHARNDMDLVARYGGEEFALIVPGASIDAASLVAHRIHSAVRALREPHAASPFGIITVSAGVAACVPSEDMTPEQLIAMAEAALHRAKRFGRNRVAYAPALSPAPSMMAAAAGQ